MLMDNRVEVVIVTVNGQRWTARFDSTDQWRPWEHLDQEGLIQVVPSGLDWNDDSQWFLYPQAVMAVRVIGVVDEVYR